MLNNLKQTPVYHRFIYFVFQSTLFMKLPFFNLRCAFLEKLFELSVFAYRNIFKRKTVAWGITMAQLAEYPKGSLGKALYIFMKHNGFGIQDKLESHDVHHVLTETGTSVPDEISMQYCLFASGKRSIYGAITIGLGTLILPEKIELYRSAYRIGNGMVNISTWDLKSLLTEPVYELRKQIYTNT